jgi:hypothetical protein
MAFMDDRCSVFLVLGLAGESELVLGLAIGNLVNAVGGRERERVCVCVKETRMFWYCIKRRKLRTGTTRL